MLNWDELHRSNINTLPEHVGMDDRKAKAQLELKLLRDVKVKKNSYRNIHSKN